MNGVSNDTKHPIKNDRIAAEARRIIEAFGLSYSVVIFNNSRGPDMDPLVHHCQACVAWQLRHLRASQNDPPVGWHRLIRVLRGVDNGHSCLIDWYKRAERHPQYQRIPVAGEINRRDSFASKPKTSKQQECAA